MALLEEVNTCALCPQHVSGQVGGVPVYYCEGCYKRWKDDILGRTPWVMGLLGIEKARRKRRNRLKKSLGSLPRFQSTLHGEAL